MTLSSNLRENPERAGDVSPLRWRSTSTLGSSSLVSNLRHGQMEVNLQQRRLTSDSILFINGLVCKTKSVSTSYTFVVIILNPYTTTLPPFHLIDVNDTIYCSSHPFLMPSRWRSKPPLNRNIPYNARITHCLTRRVYQYCVFLPVLQYRLIMKLLWHRREFDGLGWLILEGYFPASWTSPHRCCRWSLRTCVMGKNSVRPIMAIDGCVWLGTAYHTGRL